MNADTIKAVKDALTPLANKIGEGASHLYEVYTRQMVAEAIAALIAMGIGTIVTITLIGFAVRLYRGFKKEKAADPGRYTQPSEVGAVVLGAAAGILSMVMLIGVGSTLPSTITKLINPEYHAIERLIYQVKGQ